MGTQQILLIVLSVIIVGAAIAVGIQMFNSQSYSANKTAIAADAQNFASQVVQFYKTPVSQGGLGGELNTGDSNTTLKKIAQFLGWDEEDLNMTNENGTYTLTSFTATTVVITGKGKQSRDNKSPKVETTVTFPEGKITAVVSDE